ncbi:hypothetical protein CYMTET_48628 [Cymbomonas tetramitiformis]|uniref:Uncharacterized protein n=1 Tax=Cymbomonas tetramitiformis TaxID=36881 RepID=A0AAE0BTH6_9CHLO|nr:hypothetical protein CYMTET_48628 [Cymbomonas tetramitiformis]
MLRCAGDGGYLMAAGAGRARPAASAKAASHSHGHSTVIFISVATKSSVSHHHDHHPTFDIALVPKISELLHCDTLLLLKNERLLRISCKANLCNNNRLIKMNQGTKLPHWMSEEEKLKYRDHPNSNTNSSMKTAKRQGDVIAVAHDVQKTGYKANNAYGAKAIFEDETTTAYHSSTVQKVGDADKKKLMPYHMNASRNRPGETLSNTVGRRFHPARNSSQVMLRDGDPDSLSAPKTTTQVYSDINHNVVGLGNQGISSDVARLVHAKQHR